MLNFSVRMCLGGLLEVKLIVVRRYTHIQVFGFWFLAYDVILQKEQKKRKKRCNVADISYLNFEYRKNIVISLLIASLFVILTPENSVLFSVHFVNGKYEVKEN